MKWEIGAQCHDNVPYISTVIFRYNAMVTALKHADKRCLQLIAILLKGNKNIYLHSILLCHIDTTLVVEVLPHVRQGPTYLPYIFVVMAENDLRHTKASVTGIFTMMDQINSIPASCNHVIFCFHIDEIIVAQSSASHEYITAQCFNLTMCVNLHNPMKVWKRFEIWHKHMMFWYVSL